MLKLFNNNNMNKLKIIQCLMNNFVECLYSFLNHYSVFDTKMILIFVKCCTIIYLMPLRKLNEHNDRTYI